MHTVPVRLNKKWANAIIMADIFPVANDARMAVVVVPILAPIVIGKAASTVRIPAATRGINKDVVIELLWTIIVNASPANNPRKGLLLITLSRIISALLTTRDFMTLTIK